jgi:hypothetical protein
MPRIIEIVLFLTPFLVFAVWRLWVPSPLPPSWLVWGLASFVGILLVALVWAWHREAEDAGRAYVPAELREGRVVPGRPAVP